MNDLRFALRMLLKKPGFTLAVVVTLALGIGLNTATFSLVNPILFRPLPVRDPARLVYLNQMNPTRGFGEHSRYMIAYPDYLDWRAQHRVFEDVGVYRGASWTVTGRGDPERIHGTMVSATLFSVLGVSPCPGRSFREGEDRPAADPVVLLGYGYWQRRWRCLAASRPGLVCRKDNRLAALTKSEWGRGVGYQSYQVPGCSLSFGPDLVV